MLRLCEVRSSIRTSKVSLSKSSLPDAVKLLTVPGSVGFGIKARRAVACGERQLIVTPQPGVPAAGMMLPGNCAPVSGSKMGRPYSLKFPCRASSVGTVRRREPPTLLRVP